MALQTMITQLREARTNYENTLKQLGEQARDEIAKALGAVVPEGKVLVWAAFTPYFNDGSPCRFSVHDPYLHDDPGDLSQIRKTWRTIDGSEADYATDEIWEVFKELDTDLMLRAYGDHTMVLVRHGGEYIVREYTDHD